MENVVMLKVHRPTENSVRSDNCNYYAIIVHNAFAKFVCSVVSASHPRVIYKQTK